jgi:hypothetical protein
LNLFAFRILLLLLSAGIAGLSQIGGILNSTNMAAWAQAVPLIPIQTGNATLDQGLPVFYDCIEEAVEESFSEQEPNYFHEEPTKSEVNDCYYDVFVVNRNNLESANQVDDSGDSSDSNDTDEKTMLVTEEEEDQSSKKTELQKEIPNEKPQHQDSASFIVTPGSW